MSLREFLREQKQERKAMRAEMKQSKKHPQTKREKVYKIVGIIFAIAVVCGSIMYACNNMSGGYDWGKITGITDDIKSKLEREVDENTLLSELKITSEDVNSCSTKFASAGVDFSQINDESSLTPTADILLNSQEIGVVAQSLTSELNGNKYDILGFSIYNILDVFYEKSVIKLDLSKYINGANLPQIYLVTISKCEIQNESLTALNYKCTINNLDESESEEVIKILNKNIVTTSIDKIASDDINISVNLLNALLSTRLELYSNGIKFCI